MGRTRKYKRYSPEFKRAALKRASVWFVLHEMLANNDVKVYDGSLHEWTMNPDSPMVTRLGQ